jgi:hypothetical protein
MWGGRGLVAIFVQLTVAFACCFAPRSHLHQCGISTKCMLVLLPLRMLAAAHALLPPSPLPCLCFRVAGSDMQRRVWVVPRSAHPPAVLQSAVVTAEQRFVGLGADTELAQQDQRVRACVGACVCM